MSNFFVIVGGENHEQEQSRHVGCIKFLARRRSQEINSGKTLIIKHLTKERNEL